jgi:hypothetical protein
MLPFLSKNVNLLIKKLTMLTKLLDLLLFGEDHSSKKLNLIKPLKPQSMKLFQYQKNLKPQLYQKKKLLKKKNLSKKLNFYKTLLST